MKKRILSLLLAVVMIVGLLPTVALAEEAGDDTPAVEKSVVMHEKEDDPIHIVKSVSGDTLTLEAWVTNPLKIVTDTVPLDIALVLDVSGSMKETIEITKYEPVYASDLKQDKYYYYQTANGGYDSVVYCNGRHSHWVWDQGYVSYQAHDAGWFTWSDHNNGNYKNPLTPKTSATDTDTTYTQFYQYAGTETKSKIDILKTAVNGFIDSVAETSPNSSIALVKFAGVKEESIGNGTYTARYNGSEQKNTNYTQIVKALTKVGKGTDSNAQDLKEAVAVLDPEGMTHTDYAMQMAETALKDSKNQKVVIVFTDGEPSEWSEYSDSVAAGAVSKAKELKSDNGGNTLIYTVAVAENADPTDTNKRINKFLHAVSSNYPNATANGNSFTLNSRAQGSNYYRVATKGDELIDIFQQISKEVSSLTLNMDTKTVLSDTLSEYFTFAGTDETYGIKVYTAAAKTDWEELEWDNPVEVTKPGLSVDPENKTITVTDFDYGANAVTIDASGKITSGKKLIVTIPITPDTACTEWKAGENYYPTNSTADDSKAGLSGYTDEKGSPLSTKLDESPEAPVRAYNVTYTSRAANETDGKPTTPADPTDTRNYIPGQTVTVADKLNADGWTFTGWTAPTGVTVAENGTFTMGSADVEFTGVWTKNPTTANVTINKASLGADLPANFNLKLTKADGTEVPLERKKGSYIYTAALEAGTYTLTETNASITGKKHTATLMKGNADTVSANPDGSWTIEITEDDLGKDLSYSLTNTYVVYAPAEVDLSALIKKTLTGDKDELSELSEDQKTFNVQLTPGILNMDGSWASRTGENASVITGTAVCGNDGVTVSFENFTKDGTALTDDKLSLDGPGPGIGAMGYYYLVEEVVPDVAVAGMRYDSSKYILEIDVKADNENHKYTATSTIYPCVEIDGAVYRGQRTEKTTITFENEYTKPASSAIKHVITSPNYIPVALEDKMSGVEFPTLVSEDKTQLIIDKSVDKVTLAYVVNVHGDIGAYATVADPGAAYVGYEIVKGDAIVTGGWGDGVMISFLDDNTTVALYYTKTFTRGTDFPGTVSNTAIVNGDTENPIESEETEIKDKTPGGYDFSDIILKDLYVTGDQNFPESLTFRAELTLDEFTNNSGVMPSSYSLVEDDPTEQDENDTAIEAFPDGLNGWEQTLYATFYPDDVTFDKHNTTSFTAQDGSHLYFTFPAEGRYTFTLKEIDDKEDGVKYDANVYKIVVYVYTYTTTENEKVLRVAQISLYKVIDGKPEWFGAGEEGDKITFYNEVDTGEIPYYPIIPILPTVKDDGKLNKTDHFAYVIGYPDGTVHPNGEITRAEVATIFFRLLKDDVRNAYFTSYNTYSDVSYGKWYNNPISTMSALGIINGYPDGTFRPDAPITRAEFAAIAARFDETATRGTTTFTDVYGHWAADEIAKAYGNDWIKGYPDGTFRPDRNITRAEAMALINRVLDRAPESPSDLLPDMNKWSDNMDTSKWYYLDIQEATNSHDYTRKTFNYELWKRMLTDPDWSRYER